MKKLLLALILGCSGLVSAQNSISGTVTNLENKPLAGVSVYAPELHKGATTDENGKYEFNNLPNGSLRIAFTFVGYTTQNKTISKLLKQNTLDIILAESVFEMDEVIVSTPFNKLQSQNVMKVEHESIKTLQQKGTSTLIEGLATIPGVSQISTGTSIGKPVIRGLSGNRVLVYSQGVRIENQQFGDEHGLGLNDAGIESVEVIKGPASLLYGSDALGGVLYFNPEKFADAHTFKANFSQKYFTNTQGSNSSIGLKTSTDNWKFLARGSFNTHSDYKIADGDRVTNSRYNETDFKTGIGYSNSSFSSVLRYNYNKLDIGIPEDGIAEQSSSKDTQFPRQGIFNHLLSLNNVIFFENSKLDVDLGYIANDRSEFEDSNDASLRMKLNTFNYNAKYHFPKLGKIETIVGVQGMHQTNANSGEEYLIPDAKTNDFGVFGTANYEWNSNVLQAGLRFDNRNITSEAHGLEGEEGYFQALNKSFDSFNASLGYKTTLAEALTMRLNVATGFRAPNLAELTSNGVHEGTNRYEIGNADLKTEQNVQTDLNLEYKNSHFEFFINGFYNHINNYIYTSPTGETLDENAVFAYIQDNAKLYGGEAGFHFHPHPLDWLHFETSFETVTGKKDNGDYLPLIPANNWNNTIRTEFKIKNWLEAGYASLNVSSTFNQPNVSGFETASNGYTLLNLGVGGTVKLGKTAFDVNLNGNNLLDKKYIAHLSRLKTDGIPNIGRNIVLGVNFNL
ncbi:TonB-dependent receptor [Flavobacterium hercynium]|uniref:TonB-dependent receptor n=1 Tax=Flavobacterium hercynium TaxID=387094 RepID=A0A226HEJ4_9FLAO|nr:TonB-dependent receptor [Flavobacterium hercynium]OXA92769.1 TonB-dependent receptor [Flavobacterium hercynium]SMP01871.1 iron complex outermembrane recepter protein [Flavobacterium hercynium]